MNSPISEKDRELIALLRQDARMPVSELARQLGLSRTAAQARLDKLERLGIIAGYSLRLGSQAAAADIRGLIMLSTQATQRRAIEAELARLPAISAVYSVSGPFDLIAAASAPSVAELDQLRDQIGALEGVVQLQLSTILSTRLDR